MHEPDVMDDLAAMTGAKVVSPYTMNRRLG